MRCAAPGKWASCQRGVVAAIHHQHQQRLREIRRRDLTAYLHVSPTELLGKVPMFAGLAEIQFAAILPYLQQRSFPKAEKIITRGERGNSLFMIARGLVSVFAEGEGAGSELGKLYAGDFFGEAALLHSTPRNATVVATTPCTLYELRHDDWQRLCAQHPEIAVAVAEVDQQRTAGSV